MYLFRTLIKRSSLTLYWTSGCCKTNDDSYVKEMSRRGSDKSDDFRHHLYQDLSVSLSLPLSLSLLPALSLILSPSTHLFLTPFSSPLSDFFSCALCFFCTSGGSSLPCKIHVLGRLALVCFVVLIKRTAHRDLFHL